MKIVKCPVCSRPVREFVEEHYVVAGGLQLAERTCHVCAKWATCHLDRMSWFKSEKPAP